MTTAVTSIDDLYDLLDTRGNSNDNSPTRGNSNDGSPTRTEVRSPTSTSTSTEVRSPTSTSTDAYTRGNVTVTGGAGAGAYTNVRVYQGAPDDFQERDGRAAGRTQERIVRDSAYALMAPRPQGVPIPLQPDATTQRVGFGAPHRQMTRAGVRGLGDASSARSTLGLIASGLALVWVAAVGVGISRRV